MTTEAPRDIVDVALVAVTYNSAAIVPEFLESLPDGLRGAGSWRLTIVDNSSRDGTLDRVAELMPDAALVQMGWNAGYAAAINEGLRRSAPARAYLVLNPDVRLDPDAVSRMQTCLAVAGTGQVVPVIRSNTGTVLPSLRREPTLRRALGEALLGGRRAARRPALGELVVDPLAYTQRSVADWATGAAVMFSADCRERVGDWNESFFLYSEETDYCLRARDAGLALRLEPTAAAVHLSGEQHSAPLLYSIAVVNKVRLYRQRHGTAAAIGYWGATAVGELLRTAAGSRVHRAALRALFRSPRATIDAARGPRPAVTKPVVVREGSVIG